MNRMTAAFTTAPDIQRHHRSLDLALKIQLWATWITGAALLLALIWGWTKIGAVTALLGNLLATELKVMLTLSLIGTVLGTWITALLYGWCRAYLAQVAKAATGQGVNMDRHQALHRTLNAYITATQWALPVGAGILVPLSLWALALFVNSLPGFGIGAAELLLIGLSVVVLLAVPILLSNLILAAVRRWLRVVSARLRGEGGPPALPAAQVAGYWFVFCAALLGLNVLSSLGALPTLALGPALSSALSSALPNLEGLSPALNISPGLITGVSVLIGALSLLGAVQNGLLLWTLLASRSFALSTAQALDAPPPIPSNPS